MHILLASPRGFCAGVNMAIETLDLSIKLFGTPIFQYTQNLRLEKALQLLHTGDYSIREVADAVGYSYSKNFTTAFKRRYGVSPKVARKSFNRAPKPRAGGA